MSLSQRSYEKELLDKDSIPFADIRQNMKELDFINKWLGGHEITLDGFRQVLGRQKQISVCEIGCGGGDNLLAIYTWCKKRGIELNITGIDIKSECIEFAKRRTGFPASVQWLVSDYKEAKFRTKPDIIFSSLFCHHFTNEQLIYQLRWMKENCTQGFFVNDLHRHILAYYSIKLLTAIFSSSYLVKNDAPLSVARGFTRQELYRLCVEAGAHNVTISWKWAFRYLITFLHAN